jgi:hypothetical protein
MGGAMGAISSGASKLGSGVKDVFSHVGKEGFDAPEGTFLDGDKGVAAGIANATAANSKPGFMDKYGKKMLVGGLQGGLLGSQHPQQQGGGGAPIVAPNQPQLDQGNDQYLQDARQRSKLFGY